MAVRIEDKLRRKDPALGATYQDFGTRVISFIEDVKTGTRVSEINKKLDILLN